MLNIVSRFVNFCILLFLLYFYIPEKEAILEAQRERRPAFPGTRHEGNNIGPATWRTREMLARCTDLPREPQRQGHS
jgi:hypothetical protein